MHKSILFNNEFFSVSLKHLPCLIHGADHSGASLFTVTYISDLYRQGAKILFLSGYHMARDEFDKQTGEPETSMLLSDAAELSTAEVKRTVYVPRERSDLFIEAVKTFRDIDERVILIKNMELFDSSVYSSIKHLKHIVLSGDLDACSYRNEILQSPLKTKIVFSSPKTDIGEYVPYLEKYNGYLWMDAMKGTVCLSEHGQ
ncbi:MAG: hypothetical protein RI947_1190 [Candidatus Parcubacteria bacterium]|jgi:hypothetical protein